MARSIKMPEFGESITEGNITRWLKQEGDRVEVDEPLFEVSTDKVDTEVPSPVAGVLTSIKVSEDETVPVGTELAEIETSAAGDGQETAPAAETQEAPAEAEAEAPAEAPAPAEEAPAAEEGETVTVRMPELGESITEGTITRWLKQEGDRVEVDEPLFEVSTDKVDTEVPSPVAGVVQSIKVGEDDTVPVGAELVEIGAQGAAPRGGRAEAPAPAPAEAPARATAAPAAQKAPARQPAATAVETDGGRRGVVPEGMVVSPLVRRLAREHRIDLTQVRGTGAGGRVRREDVEAYLAGRGREPSAPAEAPPETAAAPAAAAPRPPAVIAVAVPLPSGVREEVVKTTRTRRIIAERMVTSLQVSAQLTSAVEVDMTEVMRLRERAKEAFRQREGVSLSPLPFCLHALIAAVKQYPNVNSALDADGNLHVYHDVHLGVAVDTPKGLFVPVIKHADNLNLAGLAKAIADVATRTRDGKISPDDPHLGEVVAVRHVMYAVLTYDHRIIDGADAARFLVKIKEVLEEADYAAELGLT